jgi:hypothetical protein
VRAGLKRTQPAHVAAALRILSIGAAIRPSALLTCGPSLKHIEREWNKNSGASLTNNWRSLAKATRDSTALTEALSRIKSA